MKKQSISLNEYNNKLKSYFARINNSDDEKLRSSLYIIFTLITVTFFGIFAIHPTLSTLSNLEKQKRDSTEAEKQLRDKITNLNTLDRQYNQLTPDLTYIYSAIPTSPKIPYLVRQIETLVTDNKLTLSRLDFQPIELYPATKTNIPLYSFTFNVNVIGKETNINNFISSLISFDRLVDLESITTGKSEVQNDLFNSAISGRVYYYN